MELNSLTAISPIDGRYRRTTAPLDAYFSEYALIRYRIMVEIEYFIALCELPLPQLKGFDKDKFEALRDIYRNFTVDGAQRVKEIERTTNHDVKAVEYFIKEQIKDMGLGQDMEFIHFGLTSQDINNTATPLSLRDAIAEVYLPTLKTLVDKLEAMAEQFMDTPMLARTHGQPASPTILGKEFKVFVERLRAQISQLNNVPFSAKFGGATGNFNAHHAAYPAIDWVEFANNFVNNRLGLTRSQFTTQIEHYDNLAALFDAMRRINTILVDFSRDIWSYISIDYFKQKIKEGEVGSSAMPHKVNPIDFENAEGNFGIASAIYEHLSAKLPISRLQRDLTDSTVLRNVGVPLAHSLIGFTSIMRGLDKLLLNNAALERDLNNAWAVIAEGVQTILRREGVANPYEALKALTRTNKPIDEQQMVEFIRSLDVNDGVRQELLALTPFCYTGIYRKK